MREQVGKARLLQRCGEGVDELVGQLADEADGVGEQVRPAAQPQRADRRVERVKQTVADAYLGVGQRVQKRRLAGVGVSHQRDLRQCCTLALRALGGARAAHAVQAPAQGGDAIARQAAVGLDLRLPRAARADASAEALEVAPQPAHAGEVVFELCQLDLQLALGAVGVRGEYVQDHRGAVDHRQAQRLLEVALLPRAQLVVAGDQVGIAGARHGPDFGHLAGAQVGVGMRTLAALDELAHDAHAGGAQKLCELA